MMPGVVVQFSQISPFIGARTRLFGVLGYFYAITGYRPGQSTNRNSWTEGWGDHGHFYTNERDFSTYYSAYIVLDPSDVDKMKDIRNARAVIYSQKAQDAGIWNGQRPEDIATPEEIRIMLGRAMNILGARTRGYWANLFEEKILRGKGLVTIWNEKDAKKNATDLEVATMFTRAVRRDKSAISGTLTRGQVASVIGRDML